MRNKQRQIRSKLLVNQGISQNNNTQRKISTINKKQQTKQTTKKPKKTQNKNQKKQKQKNQKKQKNKNQN